MLFITNTIYKYLGQNFKKEERVFANIKVSDLEVEVEQLVLKTHFHHPIIMERPIKVSGVVIPTETKGRMVTPDPIAFKSLSSYIKSVTTKQKFAFLAEHSDRGHILALQFGTANDPYNIIPQWAGFQEYGDWRKLEVKFVNLAKELLKNNNSLFLTVDVEYLNLNMQHLEKKLESLFDFSDHHFVEEKVKKCMQVFGTPSSYSYYAFPCNVYITKPSNYSLSIPYVKHLYEVALLLDKSKSKAKFKTKLKATQKKLNSEWDLSELQETDLPNLNSDLKEKLSLYAHEGIIGLSAMTEEDV